MSAKGLKKIIKKLEETGSFAIQSGREKKSIALTSVVNAITALQEGCMTFSSSCI